MSSSNQSSKLKEWLDHLQQESWQLELLVSGFAIFLLLGSFDSLLGLRYQVIHYTFSNPHLGFAFLPYAILLGGCFMLLINLIIHVILRGLWISSIGLRFVSGDIDLEKLGYRPKFNGFLQRRIGSFDRYIEQLEKLCSAIFAFTFLLIFMVFAIGLFVIFMGGLELLVGWLLESTEYKMFVSNIISVVFGLFGFLYFVDFVSLGYLKRLKWLEKWYYPVYRIMGYLTAAGLYRSLYHNLIDNRFGRRLGFMLVPYLILLMVLTSITYKKDTFIPTAHDKKTRIATQHYDDETTHTSFSTHASLPSRYVDNGYLEVFIPYFPKEDDAVIRSYCPDLPDAQMTGWALQGTINLNFHDAPENTDSILLCMNELYRIQVDDSTYTHPPLHFYRHEQRKDQGTLAVLDIAYLRRGQHSLLIEKQRLREDSLQWILDSHIVFWVE